MAADPTTQLIERGELRMLVEATRDRSQLAHVIRKPRATSPMRAHQPSAVRGLVWLVAAAWLVRELVSWLF
jgi:hypothetical protein